jgi:Ca2+-binding EF-hand superfamily protein
MGSIDYDSDGYVRYKEFLRKLSRHGVKSRTPEEQILYLLIDTLKKINFKSLAEAFELFDKKRTGSISRDDFKDVFSTLKGLRVDEAEIDRFIDHFWRD